MPNKVAVEGAARPPAVRVPTLEPPASQLFIGTHALRSNVYQKDVKGSTLSDYYKPRQTSVAWRQDNDVNQLTSFDLHTDTTQFEDVFLRNCGTSPVSVTAVEESGGASPLPRNITPPRRSGSIARSERRSGSPERTQCARLTSAKKTSQSSDLRARPAWNQNCPTPRVRPTISAPQTEPRLLTRERRVKDRSRPWLEGLKRMDSSGSKLSTENNKTTCNSTQKNMSSHFSNTPLNTRKSPSSAVLTPRVVFQKTRDSDTLKGNAAFQPHLELLEKSLHESQQRVLRVEARCEELEVALQTLTSQHHDVTSRLEKRNAQLAAQLQYVLQCIEHVDITRVSKEPVTRGDIIKNDLKETADVEVPPYNSLTSSDAVCHSPISENEGSANMATGIELTLKATPVRVPPAPPMMLQLQHH